MSQDNGCYTIPTRRAARNPPRFTARRAACDLDPHRIGRAVAAASPGPPASLPLAAGVVAVSHAPLARPGKVWNPQGMVRLDDIGMRYGRGPEVLHGISLSLPEGSFHWLTGPSGAGKTSLIRLLSLTERPSRGTISLFGQNPDALGRKARQALRRQIGVVYQDFRLLGHLSAFDNVALPLRLAGVNEAAIAANTAELLAWVGLAERMAARPVTLSGGEQQRLAIARAVVAGPRLIVADEPTGDLDERQAERLLGLLVSLNRNGTTVLVATHNERLIERFPAPRLELGHGRLAARHG